MSFLPDQAEQTDKVVNALLARSTEAVLAYREASQLPDNDLPEEFIASYITVPLHRDLGLHCRRECFYTCIASHMDVEITNKVLKSIGQLRADLAMIDANGRFRYAVELKIDDGVNRRPYAIVDDIWKLRKLTSLCTVTPLALVMMTETEDDRTLADRRKELQDMTGKATWVWGVEQLSGNRKWKWAMGCANVSVT